MPPWFPLGSLLVLVLSLCSVRRIWSIDPQERIGSCKPVHLSNVTWNIFSNEGVWFPQYRVLEPESYRKGHVYSCHVSHDKVLVLEDQPTLLESDVYYVLDGKVEKEPFTSSYQKSKELGATETPVNITGHGQYKVYNYVLKLTPEFRVRYVCTDFKLTTPGVAAIYVETRSAFPKKKTIKQAQEVLRKHGLKKTLVRIVQKNCKRPLNKDGYEKTSASEEQR